MLDYSIDAIDYRNYENYYIVNIHGWVLQANYSLVVKADSGKVIKEFFGTETRYDVCLSHGRIVSDDLFGFKESILIPNGTKYISIYCKYEDGKNLSRVYSIALDTKFEKKVKWWNFIDKSKKRIQNYANLKNQKVLIAHINERVFHKKSNVLEKVYDPTLANEYEEWLSLQKLRHNKSNIRKMDKSRSILNDITFISLNSAIKLEGVSFLHQSVLNLEQVKTNYVCLMGEKCELYDIFLSHLYKAKYYDILYFDNDSKNAQGIRYSPQLKPNFSYDTLQSVNYIGHLFVTKTKMLKSLDNTPIDLYSYLLKICEPTTKIGHVSAIVYNDNQALEYNGKVFKQNIFSPLISIIIPTKDHKNDLKKCIDSIIQNSTYKNYEIIIINNNSVLNETFDYFAFLQKEFKNIKVIDLNCEFNYSYLNNYAINNYAKGDYIVLLNNDIEVITSNWLEKMLEYATRKGIGSVGAFLLFPDNTIQHAGVIMGKGGIAGHAYSGISSDTPGVNFELKVPYNVSCCTAACLMVKKDVYLELNGLNESLKVAFNDVDFGLRLLEAGYRNVFLPQVKLYHYESKSRGIDKSAAQIKRYSHECDFIRIHWAKYLKEDPFYNVQYSRENDYKLKI